MQSSRDGKQPAVSADQLTHELLGFIGVIMRTSQGRVVGVADDLGLGLSQLKIMMMLAGCGRELPSSVVAGRLGLSPAATSRAADDLVRRDLLTRREAEHDRRIKLLGLSAAGRLGIDRMNAARHEATRDFAETLTPEQRTRASAALQPLLALIAELTTPTTCERTSDDG